MDKPTFTLRIDLESNKGIKKGVPGLLRLLRRYGLKASFYICMGGESGFAELIKNRGRLESAGERKIKVFSFLEKIGIVFFPKDFVKDNLETLKQILAEGHELGIHGWKHREWTRGLETLDIENRIKKSVKKYEKLFKRKPKSFAAPGFNTNERVLSVLKENGFEFISDLGGKEVSQIKGMKNIPITINGNNKTPIVEFLSSSNMDDKEIIEILKKEMVGKKIISFYVHGLYELIFRLDLLEKIFEFVRAEEIKSKRVIDY